ncbi:thiol reductant ABC exporter subunit CydD [Actinotalea sp.]|uniref:thiol reductant ABC exporter subunit CydD n=1 Tax=Actinotalea sp. TaxID=1872145 RepID=UPI0035667AA6
MKPLDPRLLKRARSARRYVLLTAGLGVLTAALVIAQALLLAAALAPVVSRTADWPQVAGHVGWLALVVLAKAVVTGVQERFAHRSATRAVAELREQVLERAVALGPRWIAAHPVSTLSTRGLDALDPYFVRYLPQLLLAVTVTPAALLVVLGLDWIAAVTMIVTLPLVPLFMVLVGRLTQTYADKRLTAMERLGHQVLDLLAGLPTLRALGRERGPEQRVGRLGEEHRLATMGTLRVAFLSGMVLELLTTLSVALVAVGIGFRLVYGEIDLQTGLAVLVLAPEVYLPLRQVGAHFHASADGVAAAEQAFAVLEEEVPEDGTVPAPDLGTATIRLKGVDVVAPDRAVLAPAGLDLAVAPGRVTALAGPNGAGKSTAVAVLLGVLSPDAGRVALDPVRGPSIDLTEIDPQTYWRQIAWVPQRPVIEPGTLRDSVLQGRTVEAGELERAAALTGLDLVVAERPGGWESTLGQGGSGLSLGQRQRLALTRALLAPAPLVVLDEPSAHLDADGEAVVLGVVERLRTSGRTVLLVAHRESLLRVADTVVEVTSAPRTVVDA